MSEFANKGHSRRTFLKFVGAGAAAASIGFPAFAAQGDVLTYGLAVPTSTYFGEAAQKAAQIAIDEINADGGVLGTPMELIVEDSGGNGSQALLSVQALDSRGADFMGGFFFSEELIGALPTFGVVRKIFMGTGASTPVATVQVANEYDTYKYFFRLGPANSFFILQASVTYAIGLLEGGLGWDSIVLMAEDAAWTTPITQSFQSLLTAFGSGLQVADVIRYPEQTTDFTPFFNQAVGSMEGRNGGFFTAMAHTGTRPTTQWAQQQVPLALHGINVQAQDGRFDTLTNGASESVVTFTSAARAPLTPLTIPFVDAFAGSDINPSVQLPSYNAFHTYDSLRLMKAAAEAVGVLPNSPANNDAIIAELESYDGEKSFQTTTGAAAFYQRDEANVTPLHMGPLPHDLRFGGEFGSGVWIQWQDGTQEAIFPSVAPDGQTQLATAMPILPPWL